MEFRLKKKVRKMCAFVQENEKLLTLMTYFLKIHSTQLQNKLTMFSKYEFHFKNLKLTTTNIDDVDHLPKKKKE